MSKKNKAGRGGGGNRGGGGRGGQGQQGGGRGGPVSMFRDITAERQLKKALADAEGYIEDEMFEEALEALVPLVQRYPLNDEVYELLGMAYLGMGLLEQARDAFEHVLDIVGKAATSAQRFQLATIYTMTGYPTLAYEQLRQVNTREFAGDLSAVAEVNNFRRTIEDAIDTLAKSNKSSREDFVKFGGTLERGQLAMAHLEMDEAIDYYQQAKKLNPKSSISYGGLGSAYEAQGKTELAIAEYRQAFEVEPDSRGGGGELIRALLGQGKTDEARGILQKVTKLPAPTDLAGKLQMAEIYAYFEDDRAIYDLLEPELDNYDPVDLDEDSEVSEDEVDQLYLYAGIAAVHLGKIDEGKEMLEALQEGENTSMLAGRTFMALDNGEEPPLPNGRFYYFTPAVFHPAADFELNRILMDVMGQMVEAGEDAEEQPTGKLNGWFAKYGQIAVDIIAFSVWTAAEPQVTLTLLTEVLDAEAQGGLELVKRVAFSRSFADGQNMAALILLNNRELIQPDEKLTIYLLGEARTGTFDELMAQLQQQVVEDAERFKGE
jgi:tetratricopeptide (TPR) repeat protein